MSRSVSTTRSIEFKTNNDMLKKTNECDCDTTELLDETYELSIQAVDSADIIGHGSSKTSGPIGGKAWVEYIYIYIFE